MEKCRQTKTNSLTDDFPIQPMFAHCPHCDGLVLTQIASWHEESITDEKTGKSKLVRVPAYIAQEPCVSPVTGEPHDCETALACTLRMHGIRWNSVWAAQWMAAIDAAQREVRER